MARHVTRGMVVLLDDPQRCGAVMAQSLEYAAHTVALTSASGDQLAAEEQAGFDEVVRAGRNGAGIDEAFRVAAERQMPWVTMRRDIGDPRDALAQMLESTGRRANDDVPGFVGLLVAAELQEVRRILAVVDLTDGQPSGLMALAAVAAAQQAQADLDVLVLGAESRIRSAPVQADDVLRISRDRDLYEQAKRRSAEESRRATWIMVEDVPDRVGIVLDQLTAEDYDLVIEDLGAIRLGGRMGRGRRIEEALGPDGPGAIARAVLERTDVSVAVVLDAIRLSVVPGAVAMGGAGALLALGVIASATPAAASSSSQRAEIRTSVSQTVDAYEQALGEAASMSSPTEVEQATEAARASADASRSAVAAATGASEADLDAPSPDSTAEEATPSQASTTPAGADQGSAPEEAEAAPGDDGAGPAETPVMSESPADLAPEEVVPEKAPEVDASSIEVGDDVDSEDVTKAQRKADKRQDELKDSRAEYKATQKEAISASDEVQSAAAGAQAAAAELAAAQQAYDEVYEQSEAQIEEATGLTGVLDGASAQAQVDAALQAQGEALQAVDAARLDAEQSLAHYQQAAVQAAEAQASLEQAAADVTAADAAHQQARATASATETAYEEALANARVSPVPGYAITTGHGQTGAMWSTGHHTGVDYAAPNGTEVVAAASGTVVEVSSGGSYGNRIVIQHADGVQTSYSHLSAIDVSVGQEVTAGQHIGAVGSTGNSTGPHLHFEVSQGGDGWSSGHFLDPAAWLAGG